MPVYRGRVQNGVVVLDGDVTLPEGASVKVEPEKESLPKDDDDGVYRLYEFAGPTGVPDLARNIDHYLYGHPRVNDEDE